MGHSEFGERPRSAYGTCLALLFSRLLDAGISPPPVADSFRNDDFATRRLQSHRLYGVDRSSTVR